MEICTNSAKAIVGKTAGTCVHQSSSTKLLHHSTVENKVPLKNIHIGKIKIIDFVKS